MQKDIRQVMKNSPLFAGLQPALIEEIAASATRKMLGAGQVLFQKGDPADALWGVLSGNIVLGVSTVDGKEMTLDICDEGEVFGEIGVLDFGPRLQQARATGKTELFRLERKQFLRHLQSSPELCFRVFSLLCSHVRGTTENLEDTALYELPNRLAKRLTLLATAPHAGNGLILNIAQSELASMLGVHRQAVNRHLKLFEKDGLIALQRQRIEILDKQALLRLAAPSQISHDGSWGAENLAALDLKAFRFSQLQEALPQPQGRHSAGLMAIDAAEYSHSLMTDADGTLKKIEAGLRSVDRAIEQHQGHTVWHTGDRVLAEFPDAQLAMQAALAIQEQVDPAISKRKSKQESLFRIGVHYGEVLGDDKHVLGIAVNTAIRLTQMSGPGGIAVSGAVRDAYAGREQVDLKFLGEHELKNVTGTVPVYSARAMSVFRMLALRAETLVPRRLRPAMVVAAAVVLLAGIWSAGDWKGRQSTPLAVSQLSIAVLPFTIGGDSAPEYLSQGIPEEVRASLSRVPGMRVIGRESSGYFVGHAAGVVDIGRELEVAWLLRGSVEGDIDKFQVRAQLINTVTSEALWEEQFHTRQANLTDLGPVIARRITVSIGLDEENDNNPGQLLPMTVNPEAYAHYLEAQSHIWLGKQRQIVNAVPLLKRVVELDPLFAEAHAILAELYASLNLLDVQAEYSPEIRQELARQSLQTALSIKPDSPLVLASAAKARLVDHDQEGALALAERALRTDPNSTAALQIRLLVESGREDWVGADQTSVRWMRLEPLSVNAMHARLRVLEMLGRDQESLEVANRVLALYPEKKVFEVQVWISNVKIKLGDRVGAIESARKAGTFAPPFDLWTGLDHDFEETDAVIPLLSVQALVYIEEYDEVRQLLMDWWKVDDPDSDGANELGYLINRGELETLAGNFETALEYFEKARLQAPADEDGGLVRAEFSPDVLDWSIQSHFPLAILKTYRKTGQNTKADVVAREWEELLAERIALFSMGSNSGINRYLYQETQYHAIEGRNSEALTKLRAWVDHGNTLFTYIAWDPYMENLRGDPEFEAIVAEVEAEMAGIREQFYKKQASLAEPGGG